MSEERTSLRLPAALRERIEAIAKEQGIKFSAAARIALQRGVAAIERDSQPAAPVAPLRRRIISRGVGE